MPPLLYIMLRRAAITAFLVSAALGSVLYFLIRPGCPAWVYIIFVAAWSLAGVLYTKWVGRHTPQRGGGRTLVIKTYEQLTGRRFEDAPPGLQQTLLAAEGSWLERTYWAAQARWSTVRKFFGAPTSNDTQPAKEEG